MRDNNTFLDYYEYEQISKVYDETCLTEYIYFIQVSTDMILLMTDDE